MKSKFIKLQVQHFRKESKLGHIFIKIYL